MVNGAFMQCLYPRHFTEIVHFIDPFTHTHSLYSPIHTHIHYIHPLIHTNIHTPMVEETMQGNQSAHQEQLGGQSLAQGLFVTNSGGARDQTVNPSGTLCVLRRFIYAAGCYCPEPLPPPYLGLPTLLVQAICNNCIQLHSQRHLSVGLRSISDTDNGLIYPMHAV